jgi:hypothetical protein
VQYIAVDETVAWWEFSIYTHMLLMNQIQWYTCTTIQ